MNLDSEYEVLESKRLVDSFLTVDKDTIRHRKYDGAISKPLDRMVVSKPDSVGILLYHTDRNCFILVEQFRYPAKNDNNGFIVEIVAGNIDLEDSVRDSVRREVLEETGYDLQEMTSITEAYSSPGISTEKLYLFYGEVNDSLMVEPGGGLDEEGEDIRIVEWSVEEAKIKLFTKSICDLKTMVAMQWFYLYKNG